MFYLKQTALVFASVLLGISCGPSPKQILPQEVSDQNQADIKIVGGEPVAESDPLFLSTVALTDAGRNYFCSGTLIGKRYVSTAGHCIKDVPKNRDIYIFIGNPKGSNKQSALIKVAKRFPNPNYVAFNRPGAGGVISDISLLILEKDIPQWAKSVPILSPTAVIPKDAPVVMAGYGQTTLGNPQSGTLRKVTSLFNHTQNKEIYLGPTPNKSGCHGDSGGPAYYTNSKGVITLVGVIVRGPQNEKDCYQTSICTDIRQFTDWIKDTITKNK